MSDYKYKRRFGPTPHYELVENYKWADSKFIKIFGPCSVESEYQISYVAKYVAEAGATHLRGGLFRAGTYTNKNFGWVTRDLMEAYYKAARRNGLENIIEILDYRDVNDVGQYCTAFQVGARQMQNYTLLREVGRAGKPVFIKRGTGATVDEWLGAADQVLNAGAKEIYLIERGSSTFHNDSRWTPCIHTIPSVKSICNVPVIFDASHSTGRRDLVEPMALAGVAAGAAGILVETHLDPDKSISDSEQALGEFEFKRLNYKVDQLIKVMNDFKV